MTARGSEPDSEREGTGKEKKWRKRKHIQRKRENIQRERERDCNRNAEIKT